ncbi:MAG: hypothetical protein V2I33_22600, partial [Kangiellaceae bacterium]|nr:hypothetical protein [Kangiellaceae bacterium]
MVKKKGILDDVQGGFRPGKIADDNLFVVDRMLEMCKERGDMIRFYGSTQTNRMIRAPEQKARDWGFPLYTRIDKSQGFFILHT